MFVSIVCLTVAPETTWSKLEKEHSLKLRCLKSLSTVLNQTPPQQSAVSACR